VAISEARSFLTGDHQERHNKGVVMHQNLLVTHHDMVL
jgi:hypothetical protein